MGFYVDIEIQPHPQTFLQEHHLSLARSRKVFRRPSTFIVTEAERILRLSFTTRESAGRRWEKRKSGAKSHGLFHLLSCSSDSPRRMTPRAKKGLVCKGLHEVMQNKCTGEYLLRSSFECLNSVTVLDQESRRPGQVVVRLSVFRFIPAPLHLETSKYNG